VLETIAYSMTALACNCSPPKDDKRRSDACIRCRRVGVCVPPPWYRARE